MFPLLRQCYSGAWRALRHPGEGHEELLPNQPGILLHAACGERRQREVLVPLAHVVHGYNLWPGGLHAASQTGDGHPAVAWHALPRRRVWRIRLPSTRLWTRLPGRLSPGLRILSRLTSIVLLVLLYPFMKFYSHLTHGSQGCSLLKYFVALKKKLLSSIHVLTSITYSTSCHQVQAVGFYSVRGWRFFCICHFPASSVYNHLPPLLTLSKLHFHIFRTNLFFL